MLPVSAPLPGEPGVPVYQHPICDVPATALATADCVSKADRVPALWELTLQWGEAALSNGQTSL